MEISDWRVSKLHRNHFGISDEGDYVNEIYREKRTLSSELYGYIIGRHGSTGHDPTLSVFTSRDVAIQGYIEKKGSWFRSWRRRYFVVRSDIGCLCYYSSSENLELLGSIKLSLNVLNIDVIDTENSLHLVYSDMQSNNKTIDWILRFQNSFI